MFPVNHFRSMTFFARLSLLLSLSLLSLAASATEATVVAFNANCHYLLVQGENSGMLLLKQQGGSGYVPAKGDAVHGLLIENYGVNFLKNTNTGQVMWFFNATKGWLAPDAAQNEYSAACGAIPVTLASQSITVTKPSPATAAYGSSFTVAASASSALPVAITSSGGCSGSGTGSATVTMAGSGGVTCTVMYNQPGNTTAFKAATQSTNTTSPVDAH